MRAARNKKPGAATSAATTSEKPGAVTSATTTGSDLHSVVIYLRVSKEEQAQSGLGLSAQETSCRDYAARHGLQVLTVHTDAGVSSGIPMDNRPALVEALGEIRPGVALLVPKRDRLARDYVEAAIADRLAEKAGGKILSAAGEGTEGDAGDPSAFLLRAMVDTFAQFERMLIRLRVKSALAVKKTRGERLGATPFGYETLDGGEVVENQAQRAVVDLARCLHREGFTVREIMQQLNDAGHRTKRGKEWLPGNTARLLKPGYIEQMG